MNKNHEIDLYRDTPIRYLGYANEVGEAFRGIIGRKWVNASYGVALMYVLTDTGDKGYKSYKAQKPVMFKTVDCLIWQLFASVLIPGVVINRICWISNNLMKKRNFFPKNKRKWFVTAFGLFSIPFIIKPIDKFVDYTLDNSLRKFEPK